LARLHEAGIGLRIGSRHPDRSQRLFGGDTDLLQSIGVDIHNEGSLQKAITGADAIVDAVSLYVEHGFETFRSVHVDAARRVARLAREAGVQHLAYISGIGSDPRSSSKYIKETLNKSGFPKAANLSILISVLRERDRCDR
jgi:uncharacterized protein YbjT (DUF2867 family)